MRSSLSSRASKSKAGLADNRNRLAVNFYQPSIIRGSRIWNTMEEDTGPLPGH